MKMFVPLAAVFLLACGYAGHAQEIKLERIYRLTITPDYTRFEYVFSVVNHKSYRMNIAADVHLLTSDQRQVGSGFIYFETPPGKRTTNSMESDAGPTPVGGTIHDAFEYRLEVRDHSIRKDYEQEGPVAGIPVVHKPG